MKTSSSSKPCPRQQPPVANGGFDFLMAGIKDKPLLTTSEVGKALGLEQETVRNLVEEGCLDAFRFCATGQRKTNRVVRRSVLLYLAQTADHDPSEFHRRVNALLAFLTRDQLAATAAEVAKLLQKP